MVKKTEIIMYQQLAIALYLVIQYSVFPRLTKLCPFPSKQLAQDFCSDQ